MEARDFDMDDYAWFGDEYAFAGKGGAGSKPTTTLLQTAGNKKGPSFNGEIPWFSFEQMIYDWQDVTELDPEKQGPELRNNLYGNAHQYKLIFDRDKLCEADGVEYFIKTLRPKYLKVLLIYTI